MERSADAVATAGVTSSAPAPALVAYLPPLLTLGAPFVEIHQRQFHA
ncbi:hypothetical protein [Conexibacter woesei]|nr:hypothetical protein [Conexibacter woesei]